MSSTEVTGTSGAGSRLGWKMTVKGNFGESWGLLRNFREFTIEKRLTTTKNNRLTSVLNLCNNKLTCSRKA